MYLKCHRRNKDGKEHRYCLQVTLKQRAKLLAPGLTPRAILKKFKALQMIDVHLPTTDVRNLVLPRYTQSERPTVVAASAPPESTRATPAAPGGALPKCGADLELKI